MWLIMMNRLNESIGLRGRVRIQLWDSRLYPSYASIVEARLRGERPLLEQSIGNLIVTAGKNHVADLLIGSSTEGFSYCGVGSGSTAPSSSDTDLEAPIGSRKQVTDRFRSNNVATFSTFFSSTDNNGTWSECGLFTAQSGGVMLCRALFTTSFTKDSSKTATIDWDITVG